MPGWLAIMPGENGRSGFVQALGGVDCAAMAGQGKGVQFAGACQPHEYVAGKVAAALRRNLVE